MEALTAGLVIALIWKIVDWAKLLLAGDWIAARTQAVVWLVATAVAWLASWADLTDGLVLLGDRPLGGLDMGSIIMLGLLIGSGASASYDIKRSIDGSDSAAMPRLASAIDRPSRRGRHRRPPGYEA